jgi:CubicO group peptidase (beta-lactamase class C family)
MNRKLSLLIVLVSLVLASLPTLAKTAPLAERLDAIVARQVPSDGPGAAVIVVQDGKTLLRRAYGMADLELNVPLEPDMIFRIGSVTKQFTAVAILQLVKEGKVSLSDPLSKYVPDFPGADKVTVEQLLDHTSGIKSYTGVPGFMARLREDMTPAQVIDIVRSEAPDFAPGEKWAYNNTGYIFLGIIIEKASGMSYTEYMQSRVFTPLGLARTFVGDENMIVPRRARGYERGPDMGYRHARYISMTQPYAAGAIESTVDDLAKWNHLLLEGKVIDKALLDKAWTSHVLPDGKPTNYGYGWQVARNDDLLFVEHGGGIMGFVSHATLVPEKKLVVVVLHNALGTDVEPEYIANRLVLETLGIEWNDTPVEMPEETLRAVTGVYDFEGVKRTITYDEGRLWAQREGGSRLGLVPVGDGQFVYERSFSMITFARGDGKELTAVFESRQQPTQKGVRVGDAVTRREITLDEAILDRYLGVYELAPGFLLTVTREGSQLFTQATGQGRAEVYAESETKFFLKVVEAEIEFGEIEEGKAGLLTLRQAGRDMPAKRVD